MHLIAHPDGAVSHKDALLQLHLAAEQRHTAAGLGGEAAGNVVVPVQHQQTVRPLVGKDVLLGLDVLLHGLVYVQVVGRQIGDDRDIRALLHGHQLEGGQLQDSDISRLHPVCIGQQRFADIAAQIDVLPRRLEQLGNNRRGGGLAVAPRYRDGFAGADLEEHLHLRGDDTPPLPCRQQLGHVGPQAGGAEDHIVLQPVQVVRPQPQLGPQALQLLRLAAEVIPLTFVAGCHRNAGTQQHFDQRRVGHADADDRHPLAPQRRQVLLYGGTHHTVPPLFYQSIVELLYPIRLEISIERNALDLDGTSGKPLRLTRGAFPCKQIVQCTPVRARMTS